MAAESGKGEGTYEEDDDDDDEEEEEEEEEEEDDDDDNIDLGSLGDWRAFRRDLVRGGGGASEAGSVSSSPSPSPSLIDDDGDVDGLGSIARASDGGSQGGGSGRGEGSTEAVAAPPPSSVSRKNEELLSSQSEDLAREYRSGVWAHEVPSVSFEGVKVEGSVIYRYFPLSPPSLNALPPSPSPPLIFPISSPTPPPPPPAGRGGGSPMSAPTRGGALPQQG